MWLTAAVDTLHVATEGKKSALQAGRTQWAVTNGKNAHILNTAELSGSTGGSTQIQKKIEVADAELLTTECGKDREVIRREFGIICDFTFFQNKYNHISE